MVAVHRPSGGVVVVGAVAAGTLPVLWSYPQSSQNRLVPARGVPQFGQGAPTGSTAVPAGADGWGVATGPGPPIFAPQVSQKSSVAEACPFGQAYVVIGPAPPARSWWTGCPAPSRRPRRPCVAVGPCR